MKLNIFSYKFGSYSLIYCAAIFACRTYSSSSSGGYRNSSNGLQRGGASGAQRSSYGTGGSNRFGGNNRNGAGGGGSSSFSRGPQQQRNGTGTAGATLRKPNWEYESLKPFKKDFYVPHQNVQSRHPREVSEYRADKQITCKGEGVPNPIQQFEEGNFPDYVMQKIQKQGFNEPTAIQVNV